MANDALFLWNFSTDRCCLARYNRTSPPRGVFEAALRVGVVALIREAGLPSQQKRSNPQMPGSYTTRHAT